MRISVFDNQHEAVKELPPERQGAFWAAFMAYVFDGTEPCFDEPMERMAWNLVRPYIDKSMTASRNGGKGGRKPRPKTNGGNQGAKPKTETKTETKAETKTETKAETEQNNQSANQSAKPPLSEYEREGFGESLKDSQTPSQGAVRADAVAGTAPPSAAIGHADARLAAAAQQQAMARAEAQAMEAAAVPCPGRVLEAVGLSGAVVA